MAQFSQGAPPPPPPMMGLHTGRIPTYKNNHGENFQTRCAAEPPACVQNAMLTKDKKPFTYTPGGLDLSQIKTPSMARRLNKQQQQQEDQENPAYFRQPSYNGHRGGGGMGAPPPPPPPPSGPPPPPPPPPLVINVTQPTKPVSEGERPEIVIPENPIGMLRKTHSPYHWESELADRLQQGPVPKFLEKSATPSPVAPQMRRMPQQNYQPPQQFSQVPPQQYSQPMSPQYQQPSQQQNKSPSTSPIWKPEPVYPPPSSHSNHSSPSINCTSPIQHPQTPTQHMLQRQDSQFNNSPSPYSTSSPSTTTSSSSSSNNTNQSISPYCETQSSTKSTTPLSSTPGSPWRQDSRNSPYIQVNSPVQYEVRSPVSPAQQPKSPMSPNVLARNNSNSPVVQNQNSAIRLVSPNNEQQNSAPWRQQQVSNTTNEQNILNVNNNQQHYYLPARPGFIKSPSPPKQNTPPQFMNTPTSPDNETRYQTHMTIPVTPRKPKTETPDSPKENLPWARNESAINKSVPPPPWCQKPVNANRDNYENNDVQPPWAQRPNETRKSLPKETPHTPLSSDPQPPWVTDNRRYETLPRAQMNKVQNMTPNVQNNGNIQGRIIPIQMDISTQEINRNVPQGTYPGKQQPHLRIIIGMNQQGQPQIVQQQIPQQHIPQQHMPQQQITRVITPQIMRMDGPPMSSSPVRNEPPIHQVQQQSQPRTRIIPIQFEPSSPGVTAPRTMFHKIHTYGPPRQSKAFRVLQQITGTQDDDDMGSIENHCGYTDL